MISDELCVNGVYSYADCENIDRYSDMIMPVALMKQEDNKGTFEFNLISSADIIKEDEAISQTISRINTRLHLLMYQQMKMQALTKVKKILKKA